MRPTVFFVSALSLLVTGCLHFEQMILLTEEGAANVRLVYSLPEDAFEAFKAAREQVDAWHERSPVSTPYWPWNEEVVRKTVADQQGELLSYESGVRDGLRYAELSYRIDNVDFEKGHELLPQLTITKGKRYGERVLALQLTDPEGGRDELSDAEFETLRQLCRGMQLRFAIRVPGAIKASTGRQIDEHTVAWTFDADKDPAFLKEPPEISLTYQMTPGVE